MMRVVVLGGAGNFGARIVRALQAEPGIQLLSAGRRAVRVAGAETVPVVRLDIDAPDFAQRLQELEPGLVIHCIGPFQQQDYRVAAAALAAGAHYIDLADGRSFVAGFAAALGSAATQQGRIAVSGASTLPALSFAVIEALRVPLAQLDSVECAIAPGQRAPRGAATLAAVFSYLGRPVSLWSGGRWARGWGWMGLRRIRFDFGTRWGALCDVPDLALLPGRYPEIKEATFHAALEVGVQHFVLWGLAGLRRLGLPLPVERWAVAMNAAAGWFDGFAGEWGGMRISVTGRDTAGLRIRRTWQLTAPALNGPEIPCFAAILLARRLVRAEPVAAPGAYACIGMLDLAAFGPEFERWGIRTRIEELAA
jgi:NAD(P)-dependent dehydrogenase (short-subunit alcohol dehydrogenase family)